MATAVGLPSDLNAEHEDLFQVVGSVERTVPQRSGNRTKRRCLTLFENISVCLERLYGNAGLVCEVRCCGSIARSSRNSCAMPGLLVKRNRAFLKTCQGQPVKFL